MNPLRVLLTGVKQETATFNPVPTELEDFEVVTGQEAVERLGSTDTEFRGAMLTFAEAGCAVLPGTMAWACSGGPVTRRAFDYLLDSIMSVVRRHTSEVDAVLVVLHGAMVSDDEPDPDGRLLAEIRAAVGMRPVVATLDLHAVLSERMVTNADALVPYHTYPHADHVMTGCRAARLLLRLSAGGASPITAAVRLPLLPRGDELLTAHGLLGTAIGSCQQLEDHATGLAAGVLLGCPYADVPDLASNVIATTDGNEGLAIETAEGVANFLWIHRHKFLADLVPLGDAILEADRTAGLTVLSDAADATSSGAPGDSNAILKALLAVGWGKRALLSIVDAPAADAAHIVGLGNRLETTLGGSLDLARHEPLWVSGIVRQLGSVDFRYEDGTMCRPGRAAVLGIGSIDILITSRPVWVVGTAVFRAFGLDPAEYDLTVVKSPNGFRTYYAPIATRIISVDAPGCTTLALHRLPYRNLQRPTFPLDDPEISPRATVYRRW